jgi:hypothetical protein
MARSRNAGLKILPTADRERRKHHDPLGLCRRLDDVALEMRLQRIHMHLLPGGRDDEQDRHLAGILIGHADCRTDLHAGKIIGDIFDRGRIDVVSAANDQILARPVSTSLSSSVR